ncbi:DUF2478 domain-containing protein [Allopusillimonas ginsengisoli]|uniref:DUF2478 domain-containing protein n=1 Tax=Allopusillimonas ginsengisoli TaxID=453575 RepID=UPI001021BA9B|nr:DUF2478 domain-containing protein [Allopusillimonas ginsengisoli]TEA78907.1 DUF2478 domain-containing protein [Allopusillimonas ginsengisoli]
MMNLPQMPVAAMVHEHGDAADELMRSLAADLQAQGFRVRGLVMVPPPQRSPEHTKRRLRDLHSGREIQIFQDLGRGSTSCCLDVAMLAQATACLRQACAEGADLVMVSRYGKQEVAGDGFASELLDLMSTGIPVLTILSHEFLDDWRRFTGGMAVELPVDEKRLKAWAAGIKPDDCRKSLAPVG